MGFGKFDVKWVVHDKIMGGCALVLHSASFNPVRYCPWETLWVDFQMSVDAFITPFCPFVRSQVDIQARSFLASFSLLVHVSESAFLVPVLKCQDIGLESLSNRFCGSNLSNRDGFCELVYCVSFTDGASVISLDDIKAFGSDCCGCATGLFGLFHCLVFMSH